MAIILASPATLTEATATFVSISNALGGIWTYDRGGLLVDRKLHEKAAKHVVQSARRPKASRTLDQPARRMLRIAWHTELAARVSQQMDEPLLRRVAAQTLPMQAYYAVFNAARAMTATAGVRCDNHTAVHKDFESQRRRRAYRSWGVSLTGDAEDAAACVIDPPICTPVSFNVMELSHTPQEFVFAALRMARRWKHDEARVNWLKSNRKTDGSPYKRLPKGVPAQLMSSLRPTTLMDFLYGLRVRTNYEGVEEYASDADDSNVLQFHRGLLHVADLGLLHYETMLAQLIGINTYEHAVKEWAAGTANVGTWATDRVERRLAAIKTAV